MHMHILTHTRTHARTHSPHFPWSLVVLILQSFCSSACLSACFCTLPWTGYVWVHLAHWVFLSPSVFHLQVFVAFFLPWFLIPLKENPLIIFLMGLRYQEPPHMFNLPLSAGRVNINTKRWRTQRTCRSRQAGAAKDSEPKVEVRFLTSSFS